MCTVKTCLSLADPICNMKDRSKDSLWPVSVPVLNAPFSPLQSVLLCFSSQEQTLGLVLPPLPLRTFHFNFKQTCFKQSFSPPGQSRRGERCLGGFQGFPPSPPSCPGPSTPPRSPQREPRCLIPTTPSSPSCRRRWRHGRRGSRDRLANDVTVMKLIDTVVENS